MEEFQEKLLKRQKEYYVKNLPVKLLRKETAVKP